MVDIAIGENRKLDRRSFLKWIGAVGLGLSPLVLAEPVRDRMWGRGLASATRMRPLMGTWVTVTVLDPSEDRAREGMEAAFQEMERLIPLLDRHTPGTPVSVLNQKGYLADVPPALSEVLQKALTISRWTGGAFDMTVKPILDLFEDHFSRMNRPPSGGEIREVLALVGMSNLSLRGGEIRFLRDGMGISLDGIAKGYIVDCAGSRLRGMGIRHALINAGGDILALGDKGNHQPWRVAIQDPWDKNRMLQMIPLRDAAVATSGDYENHFDSDRKFHHIIDPQTGFSPHHFTSVSVIAPSLALADGLATAAFIPTPERAKDFLRSISGACALWVHRTRRKEQSTGWPEALA